MSDSRRDTATRFRSKVASSAPEARWGAAALVAFLVPVTLVFHDFWAYQGAEARLQMVQLLKNVGIGGGLLAIFAAGPGALSVDARRSRAAAVHDTSARVPAR